MDSKSLVEVINNKLYAFSGRSTGDNNAIEIFYLPDTNGEIEFSTSTLKIIKLITDTADTIPDNARYFALTGDGKRLILPIRENTSNSHYNLQFYIIDAESLINAYENNNTQTVMPYLQKYVYGDVYKSSYIRNIYTNESGTIVLCPVANDGIGYSTSSYGIVGMTKAMDTENIIAIKYKNEYFSKVQPQTLSAGGPDVRAGKTFIGWQGYPETGTMEVE